MLHAGTRTCARQRGEGHGSDIQRPRRTVGDAPRSVRTRRLKPLQFQFRCVACHRSSSLRSACSLRVQFRTTLSSAAGASGAKVETAGTSVSRILAIRLACVFASNARRPVAISYRSCRARRCRCAHPRAAPCSCSGAMYCSVPTIVPCAVPVPGVVGQHRQRLTAAPTVCFARPKSSSFAPVREHDVARLQIPVDDAVSMRRLEGVGDLDAEAETWASGTGPRSRRAASVSPSSNSRTR